MLAQYAESDTDNSSPTATTSPLHEAPNDINRMRHEANGCWTLIAIQAFQSVIGVVVPADD
jgi:hypothetical protein